MENIKRILFEEFIGEGLVIGQTYRKEGIYHPGGNSDYWIIGETDQGYLETTNVVTFWKVLTKFNNVYLVPKYDAIELDKIEINCFNSNKNNT